MFTIINRPNNSGGNSDHNTNNKATPLSNGDVEMESDEDDDDGRPLEPLPLPKVSQFFQKNARFLMLKNS